MARWKQVLSSNACTIGHRIDTSHETAGAEIRAELAEVCGVLNVAHARLVALTAQALDQDLWQGWGIRSVEHWLCWQTGISPSRARQIAAAARRYDELPATMATFSAGELSVDQVVAVAERVPAHNDAQVAAFATCATVSQLRKVLCRQMFSFPEDADSDGDDVADGALEDAAAAAAAPIVDPTAEAARLTAAEAAASLVMGDDGSRFFVHFEASVETGALVRQALSEARDRLFDAGHGKAAWADALVDVCGRSLGAAPKPRQSHYRVLVHLNTSGGWVNAGSSVPPRLLRKVTCDVRIAPLWETDGRPVNVGRSSRCGRLRETRAGAGQRRTARRTATPVLPDQPRSAASSGSAPSPQRCCLNAVRPHLTRVSL